MTKFEASAVLAIAGLIAAGVGGAWHIRSDREHSREEYKAACTKSSGTPVHNGRNWECLK